MSTPVPAPVIALAVHARQVPATERERFGARLRAELGSRAVILETCHRVEAYTTAIEASGLAGVASWLPAGGRLLTGEPAVRHAVGVAAGLDSVVIGEDQILHQLRTAVDAARTSNALEPTIERLFAVALHAGRQARSWQPGHRRSLADVAVDAVEGRIGPIRGRDVLIVGAGRMGGLAARAAVSAGARVTVATRARERAEALAASVGATATDFDPGPALSRFAAVVVALGGPWLVAPKTADALVGGDATVVDLSVPLAVAPSLATRLGERLITADHLALGTGVPGAHGGVPDRRTEALIERAVEEFNEWHARGDARSAADELVRRADREREAELAALWRVLPTLEPEARAAIEGMTRHLAARLLRQPLERLGRDGDGIDGRTVRDLFAL
ncbi:MAG: glutamyl-tRNA reductase [Chloroflexota bacterium]|nr:glutamyl-tRNA reductase [Chloroflexota bacterium]